VDLLSGPVTAEEPAGLRLNISTAPNSRARVALMNAEYEAIDGFGFDDCDPLSGDHLEAPVTWKGSPELPGGPGKLIARVELEDASLWAFSFGVS
jgi:hypothetical protein